MALNVTTDYITAHLLSSWFGGQMDLSDMKRKCHVDTGPKCSPASSRNAKLN